MVEKKNCFPTLNEDKNNKVQLNFCLNNAFKYIKNDKKTGKGDQIIKNKKIFEILLTSLDEFPPFLYIFFILYKF